MTSWLEQTDTPVHLLRYEDMRVDPVAAFTGALAFAQRPASAEDIERAVRHADFGELQRQESEKGFGERMSRTAPFFRLAKLASAPGTDLDQVARIESAHGPMMERLGYARSGANACGRQRCG